jgi:hypothetical protein
VRHEAAGDVTVAGLREVNETSALTVTQAARPC